jgi:L-threonylcarbamoyladenylate synthase
LLGPSPVCLRPTGSDVNDTSLVSATGLLTTDVGSAVAALRAGGLVALPTETVYGLGALASDADAVARIYAVKGRPSHHPVIVHIADFDALPRWASTIPDYAQRLAQRLWPGPLTLVLPKADHVGDYLTGAHPTVGLRSPDHRLTQQVLRALDDGVAAPSANRFGRVSPTTAQHVDEELGQRLDPSRDLILDGGPCPVGVESTIVDATGARPRVLRPGAVSAQRVSELGEVPVVDAASPTTDAVPAPGTLPAHYAPTARVVLTEPDQADATLAALGDDVTVGVLALRQVDVDAGRVVDGTLVPLAQPDDVDSYARGLYAALRRADDLQLPIVLAVLPPDTGVGHAIRDRLRRAAHGSGGST